MGQPHGKAIGRDISRSGSRVGADAGFVSEGHDPRRASAPRTYQRIGLIDLFLMNWPSAP
jgi:hypothetical protein